MELWEANEHAEDKTFEDFTASMLNISAQLRVNGEDARSFMCNLVGVSRSISVELRKLLLGDRLISKCVRRPKLHMIIRPDRLKGDPFEDSFMVQGGNLRITKLDEPGRGMGSEFGIAPMKHTVVIYPLYGLCFQKGPNVWISEDPFAKELTPIGLDWWLKHPVLQIDRDRYDMRDMLSEVANTQGAHSDRREDSIRQQISEHFQSIYLNIFTLRVGIYMSNQFSASVSANSSLRERIGRVYPEIMEDLYTVEAKLKWGKDQLPIHHGAMTLHFDVEAQQTPNNEGVGPRLVEELSTTIEIKVPSS